MKPADPDFEKRTRASFAHCATGLQTLMSVIGRAGVKD
jgi:hypothetical protein